MEWLINHPEELMEAAPTAPAPQADQVPAVAKAINLAPAQVVHPSPSTCPSLSAIGTHWPMASAQVLTPMTCISAMNQQLLFMER